MKKPVDVDYKFGKKAAHDKIQETIRRTQNGKFTLFVSYFNEDGKIAEFEYLENAELVKKELVYEFNSNVSDGGHTQMTMNATTQLNGRFFLIFK